MAQGGISSGLDSLWQYGSMNWKLIFQEKGFDFEFYYLLNSLSSVLEKDLSVESYKHVSSNRRG